MDTKLQQLESLMASRLIFGPESDREEGREAVRARWNRLRQAQVRLGVALFGPMREDGLSSRAVAHARNSGLGYASFAVAQ
jgi:hypothetical protein